MIDRREFLKTSALASAGTLLRRSDAPAQVEPKQIAIRTLAADSLMTRLATRELLSGLRMLHAATEVKQTSDDSVADATLLTLTLDPSRFKGNEDYEISASGDGAIFRGSSEQALLYAVFDFLERQGVVFGVDGTTVPIDLPAELHLPDQSQPWSASPRFATRGLLPWPDFLNCISVYNDEDFKAYFAAMCACVSIRSACTFTRKMIPAH